VAHAQRPVNYYDILTVAPNATTDEIHAAYRARINQYHPDRNHSTHATAIAALINEAWEVLGDSERRRRYDVALGFDHDAERGEPRESHEQKNSSRNASNAAPPVANPSPPPFPPRQAAAARPNDSDAEPACPTCHARGTWVRSGKESVRCWQCGASFASFADVASAQENIQEGRSRRLRTIVIAVSGGVFLLGLWLLPVLSDAGDPAATAAYVPVGLLSFFAACILLIAVLRPLVLRLDEWASDYFRG
jgi:curved DNA-binding protein CbpA